MIFPSVRMTEVWFGLVQSQWSADNSGRTEILAIYQGNNKQDFWSLWPADWPSYTEIAD